MSVDKEYILKNFEFVPMKPGYNRIKDMESMRKQGFTFAEIGKKYGISRQRVHQILKKVR